MRRLLITRRTVRQDRSVDYDTAWERLQARVKGAGGRAWRFRREDRPDHFVEFIEWAGTPAVPDLQPVAAARFDLDTFGPGNGELCVEAPA